MQISLSAYFATLARLGQATVATDGVGSALEADSAVRWVQQAVQAAHDGDGKVMFIGNGGSAGIASHCAIDYSKNGGLRSLAFNDGAALTCIGNDYGYDHVFAKQIAWHGRPADVLVAISSSGNSVNILNGVAAARAKGCGVVTLSGFGADNRLRALGNVNFYVDSMAYGFVEIAHLAIIHAILDLRQP